MSLYQKYRPKDFDGVIGNEREVKAISKLLSSPEHPHSYMLCGPTGCGKTTVARIIADKVGAEEFSLNEYNIANTRGIDTIREIIEKTAYRPVLGNSVFIMDECHMLTTEAQQALLKILEDTPEYVYFILCTTDPNKIIKTIHTRCTTFNLTPLSVEQIYYLLKMVKKAEKMPLSGDDLDAIARNCGGIPRNALVMLQTASSIEEDDKRLEFILQNSYIDESLDVIDLCRAVYNGRPWKEQTTILDRLKKDKIDAERVRRAILGYLSAVIMKTRDDATAYTMGHFVEPYYNVGFPGLVLSCYKARHLDHKKERNIEVF